MSYQKLFQGILILILIAIIILKHIVPLFFIYLSLTMYPQYYIFLLLFFISRNNSVNYDLKSSSS